MEYDRFCPTCNKLIQYASKYSYIKACNKETNCKTCTAIFNFNKMHNEIKIGSRKNGFFEKTHTKKTKHNISVNVKTAYINGRLNVSGKNNGMYGKTGKDYPYLTVSMYDKWIKKYGIEIANVKQAELNVKRSLSVSGKNNPMYGKPSPVGSGNGWAGWYNGHYFRSLLELTYMIDVLDRFNISWVSGETVPIPYIDLLGNAKTYFSDFIIIDKYMIEIKPKKLQYAPSVLCKKEAAINYCKLNNLTYKITTPIKIISLNRLVEYINIGKINLLQRYQEKLQNYISK